jgi:lipoyl(octanoyl) transferase
MKTCLVVDLGVIAYGRALELQRRLVEARKAGATPDVLLLCEHPSVVTLGRNGHQENLRASERVLI